MFDGNDITGMPPERIAAHGLARTFQLVQLFGDLTAFENIKVGCHLHTSGGLLAAVLRLPRTQKSEKAVEEAGRRLLDFVGLSDCADTQPANLLTAISGCSRSPARWRRGRSCCCSTSRPPASIPPEPRACPTRSGGSPPRARRSSSSSTI